MKTEIFFICWLNTKLQGQTESVLPNDLVTLQPFWWTLLPRLTLKCGTQWRGHLGSLCTPRT